MIAASNFLQELAPGLDLELVDQAPCGRALLWVGLLRRLRLRETIDTLLPTEADVSHGTVIEALVVNRLTSPKPLYEVAAWARDSGFAAVTGLDPAKLNDDRLGRALDALAPRCDATHAELTLTAARAFGVRITDVNYDTTTLYLEGDYADSALAAHGFSKDRRPDHLQVKVGLAATADGQVPVAHQTLPGGRADVVTLPAALAALRPHLVARPVVISGDGATWSQANMDLTARAGGVFLGPIAMIPAVAAWVAATTPDVEVPVVLPGAAAPVEFRACVVSRFAVDGVADAGARLVVFDPRRAAAEAADRAAALARYAAAVAALRPRLNVRTLKTAEQIDRTLTALAKRHGLAARYVHVARTGTPGAYTLTATEDGAALVAAAARDGKWPLVTNQPGLTDADLCRWAVARYKRHGRCERDHHLLKGPLRLRPVFLHTDDRIRALIAVTVFALMAWTLLERAARPVLPPGHRRGPAVAQVERLMATVALATFRLQPFGTVQRLTTGLHPQLRVLVRGLGWLHEVEYLLATALRRPVPS